MKKLLLGLALALLPGLAFAQSSPGLRTGQVPTASQWNSYFAAKQDVLGYTPLNVAGGTMLGEFVTKASATGGAGFNIPPGVAPTAPVDGDIWTTTSGMFVRINGATVGPLSTGGGGGGTITLTGDVTGSGTGTFATTLATVNSTVGSFGSSTAIPTFTVNGKGLITSVSTNVVIAPAGTLTGATLAANVLASSLTSVGTLTGGATGAGFTLALSTSTVTGTLAAARLPAFAGGNVTSSAGSAVLTIGAAQVTNAMLAGSIDLTTKVTGVLPYANGGCNAVTASACLSGLGGVPLAGGTMTGLLILSADPVTALGAATKGYVDANAAGIQNKGPSATATSANIALTGEQTINGVTTSGSTVLVKNQTAPEENGLYVTAAGAWTRATNLDTWTEALGAYTFVNGGTLIGQSFTAQVTAGGTIGTTPMPWGLFNATTAYTAGAGLTLTGSQFSITTAGVTNAMLAGSITSAKLVGSDIATVGTITSGTWQGTAVGTQWGGTGQNWSASSGIPLLTSGTASLLASTGSGNVVRNTTPTINALTVTGSFTATGLVTNADLVNPSLTVGVTNVSLGGTASILTFANNNPIQWRTTGGSPINALYVDPSNNFQVGGGLSVQVPSGSLVLTGQAAPAILFAPVGGTGTRNANFVQFADILYLQAAGVANLFFFDIANGNLNIGGLPGERLGVIGVDNNPATNIARFAANNNAAGVGIGWQSVRQTNPGVSLQIDSGTTGILSLNANATGPVSLANAGGGVGIGAGSTAPRGPLEVNYTLASPTALTSAVSGGVIFGNGFNVGVQIGTTGSPYDTYIQPRVLTASSQALSLVLNPLGGAVGVSTYNPITALTSGQGIAIGQLAGLGILQVNPYVDSNDTMSGLVVKLIDQAAGSTYGATGYQYALIGTILSTHNNAGAATDPSTGQPFGANKVGVMGAAQASGGSSGNVFGGYFECQLDPASNSASACIGTEIDVNNYSVNKTNNFANPAYGLQLTGVSTFPSTAALLIAGTTSQWARGIAAVNMRSFTTIYGLDLAFDVSNSFGSAAIRLPNNQTIAWIRAGTGTDLNGMYLDASDVFQIGGGLPVAMAGLGAIAQTAVVCYNTGTGLLSYQAWTTGCLASSARYKREIAPIDPDQALRIASSIMAVTYRYRPELDLGSDLHTGFTAENVADADQDLVSFDKQGRPEAVKYQEITPILAGAVQRLKAKNEALEEKVRGLEKAVQDR